MGKTVKFYLKLIIINEDKTKSLITKHAATDEQIYT